MMNIIQLILLAVSIAVVLVFSKQVRSLKKQLDCLDHKSRVLSRTLDRTSRVAYNTAEEVVLLKSKLYLAPVEDTAKENSDETIKS